VKLPDPYYYLSNFQRALDWLAGRYEDLLNESERAFVGGFPLLPKNSRALLVRMIMRKGRLFRLRKLNYAEIGCSRAAVGALLQAGWISDNASLSVEELFTLLTSEELKKLFPAHANGRRKRELLEALLPLYPQPRPMSDWAENFPEPVYELCCREVCERLRLMYFGNLHQDWSEFVLADLGVYRYERVAFSADSRAFQRREDLEDYLHLHGCRQRFDAGEPPDRILQDIPLAVYGNAWVEQRRAKLLFLLARYYESQREWGQAHPLYLASTHPGARLRAIRVLEHSGRSDEALAVAEQAALAPENDAEAQGVARLLTRLRRRLGVAHFPVHSEAAAVERMELTLPKPKQVHGVERLVCEHLARQGPTYYVENALINSLFGLLCWEAIFAPLPGAFFHPFQSGPADIFRRDFASRRAALFDGCLGQLRSGDYCDTIRANFRAKHGLQSPFVHWGCLDETLLEQALVCIPATHLQLWFERLLRDIKSNRSGMPDLIQLWPEQRRYRMIEVKGPGDRLQDNQLRWMAFCRQWRMPVTVCHVRWLSADG